MRKKKTKGQYGTVTCYLYGGMGHSGGVQRDGSGGGGKYLVKSESGNRLK